MKEITIKKTSYVLVCITTVLLVFIVIQFLAVLRKEAGIFNELPLFLQKSIFYLYFVLQTLSFILFLASKRIKSRFDGTASVLYFLHACTLLVLVIVYGIEVVKSL